MHILGETVMLADIQMTYLLAMADEAGSLARHPRVAAYLEKLKSQPGFKRAEEKGDREAARRDGR